MIVTPEGDATTYTYEAGTTAASALTVTVGRELTSAGAGIAGRSTRTETVYDALGRVREVSEGVYVDGTSGWKDYEKTFHDYSDGTNGPRGYRYQQRVDDMVGSNDIRTVSQSVWSGGRLVSETDEAGTQVSYEYDLYDRRDKSTRAAVAAAGGHAAQSAVVTTITSTDPRREGERIGFRDEETEVTAGSLKLVSSVARDDWGRVTSRSDPNGYTTGYSYADSGRTVTTTRPDGKTEITDYHKDGRMDSLTGTGVVADYAGYVPHASDGTLATTRYTATDGGVRYVETVTNMLGQTVSTKQPSLNGVTASDTTVTHYYEAGTGDPERSTSSASNVPHRLLWEDTTRTTRRAVASVDTSIDLGSDRISETRMSYAFDSGNDELWRVTESYVYPTASSSTAKLVSTGATLLGGFGSNEIGRSVSTNELSGQTTVTSTTLSGGVRTHTTDHPSATEDSVSVSFHGRLMSSIVPGAGATSYGYDDLGRRTSVTDPRTGASSYTYHDRPSSTGYTTNLVASVTDAASNTTSYTYGAQGSPGAGQVTVVTRPDTSTTSTSYTALGDVQARWGAGTYATYHVYDGYGQMTELRTYQDLAPVTEPTSATTGYSTVWDYDDATGLLLAKRDDDNKGADYTYDPAGRVATRKWARTDSGETARVLTTYGYTGFGELDTVAYANCSEDTPALNYDYDRLGRVTLVTQGTATTHTYGYDGSTLALADESFSYDLDRDGNVDMSRELVRHRDAHLRSTGYEFGPFSFTTPELSAGYGYDANTGRLDRVWHDPSFSSGIPQGSADFTYSYRYGVSDSLHVGTDSAVGSGVTDSGTLFHMKGPVHEVILSYEDDRDVLAVRENEEITGTDDWSRYAYSVNALGHRTALDLALDPDVDGSGLVSSDVTWAYSERDEVEVADHEVSTHERAYAYDAIGNRKETVEGTTTLTDTDDYTANSVNEYTQVEGSSTGLAHDDDGNLTGDGTLVYFWDAENRLVRVTDGTDTLAEYAYDYLGRRIGKATTASAPQLEDSFVYFYDGWNLIAEFSPEEVVAESEEEENYWVDTLDFSYTWGLDLSQTPQGAGGVGGLLVVEKSGSDSGEYYPTYDGNGNVSEYLNASGGQVAHYEYDPFGKQLSLSTGSLDLFAFRFSTKYLDAETGFYYYGFRYLDTVTGRWLSRDPIGERGGLNLYGFVYNNSNKWMDVLGRFPSGVEEGWDTGIAEIAPPIFGVPGITDPVPPSPGPLDPSPIFAGQELTLTANEQGGAPTSTCGRFNISITWGLSGGRSHPINGGVIIQKVTFTWGIVECKGSRHVEKGFPSPLTYYEAWRVPPGSSLPSTAGGSDTLGWNSMELLRCGFVSIEAQATYYDNASIPDSFISNNGFTFAGPELPAGLGDPGIGGTPSNTVTRYASNSWKCCDGQPKNGNLVYSKQ